MGIPSVGLPCVSSLLFQKSSDPETAVVGVGIFDSDTDTDPGRQKARKYWALFRISQRQNQGGEGETSNRGQQQCYDEGDAELVAKPHGVELAHSAPMLKGGRKKSRCPENHEKVGKIFDTNGTGVAQ
jgi:hypothetical protein